ncbi:MAG: flagellar motor switch protein FliG [Oceanospirillaceae bacterium]|nr:flagellar motor switch protein FliG [Oceanospirillaceae bacterium]MCP5350088.1 flagellar motor switch protein FliG [Oceanospirillaceae bacterium]
MPDDKALATTDNKAVKEVKNDLAGLSKLDRAAILLMSLGEKDAAELLKHMGPKEVQRVGAAMAQLRDVTQAQVEGVVAEFLDSLSGQTGMGLGADEYIRSMLTQALGSDKAAGLIDRILLGGNTTGLDTLKWMESRAVSDIIRHEHPQIQAIVIAYLDADQAAEILLNFDEKVRLDILMRVASLQAVQPAALQELNDILEKQFSGNSGTQTTAMGGVKVAASIINFVDSNTANELLDSIKEVDEELGTQIQDLMFVFENLIDVDDRGIQTLLREVSTDLLVLALKGADEDLKEKIFKNMSKRAAELLRDDLEAKGPVKVSEVEASQKEILTIARRLADAGTIVLGGAGGEAMM